MDYQEATDSSTGLVWWRSAGSGTLRILPDVNADLMFWRGGLQIAGYDTVAHEFDRGPGECTFGIRLPAGVLPALLHDSATSATDARVPVRLPSGDARLARMIGQLPAAANTAEALRDIAVRLLARADPDPETGRTADVILELARRDLSVHAMAETLGWTQRRLHRFSTETFGTSASVLRSLCRFRRAHALLSAGTRPAEAGALAGYADQAHLTRHVKRFAATTPGELVKSS